MEGDSVNGEFMRYVKKFSETGTAGGTDNEDVFA